MKTTDVLKHATYTVFIFLMCSTAHAAFPANGNAAVNLMNALIGSGYAVDVESGMRIVQTSGNEGILCEWLGDVTTPSKNVICRAIEDGSGNIRVLANPLNLAKALSAIAGAKDSGAQRIYISAYPITCSDDGELPICISANP